MNDFNFKSLDGREYIYTNKLRDLVIEAYGNKLQRNIRSSYRVVCPRCRQRNINKGELNYSKTNLSISRDFTIGHCYRCDAVFIDREADLDSKVDEPTIDTKLQELDRKLEVCEIDTSILSTSVPVIQSAEATVYLSNRNRYLNPLDYLLTYKPNKIFIPFYYDYKLIYYQIRYINPYNPSMKYFSPPVEHKPIYIPLYKGEYLWNIGNTTILCEGALTAIALRCIIKDEYNIAALLGKSITDYQIHLLKNLGVSNIYIMLDDTNLSYSLKQSNYEFLHKAKIIQSDGRDAEELIRDYGITNVYNYIKQIINSNLNISIYRDVNQNTDYLFSEFKEGKINGIQ